MQEGPPGLGRSRRSTKQRVRDIALAAAHRAQRNLQLAANVPVSTSPLLSVSSSLPSSPRSTGSASIDHEFSYA
jgi:hypothetical protein